MSCQTHVIIDIAALKNNVAIVRKAAPDSKVMAVIKADAYGHGLLLVAQALSNVEGFAVARLDEALLLRKAGVKKPILVLTGFLSKVELIDFSYYDLDAVIHSEFQLELLNLVTDIAPLSIWLKINTGMNRLGIEPSDVHRIHDSLQLSGKVRFPIKLMTHFSCADDMESPMTKRQIELFDDAIQELNGEQSLANSAGLLGWGYAQRHWVRPGIMLYGGSPFCNKPANKDGLQAVMTFKSNVLSLRTVKKGGCVGYGGSWVAEKTSLIAIIGVGYGDGYPRHASVGTPVLIAGLKAPLVGRVSMDSITVDVSDCIEVKVGDEVVLWGCGLPIEEVATKCGTISYELMCGITDRVEKIVMDVSDGS